MNILGEIVAIGQEVKGFNIGDRVSGKGILLCGHCRNCRGGRTHLCRNTIGVGVNRPGLFCGISGYSRLLMHLKIPDNIPDELAAILIPFEVTQHTHGVIF